MNKSAAMAMCLIDCSHRKKDRLACAPRLDAVFQGDFALRNGLRHRLTVGLLRSGEIVPQNSALVKISENFMALPPDRIFPARRFDKEAKFTILGYSIFEIILCRACGGVFIANRPREQERPNR